MAAAGGLSRIHQIAMQVKDIERAARFYRDALGLPFLFAAPPQLAFFDCGGVRLMLSAGDGSGGGSASVLYFAVEDIGQVHAMLTGRGVAFKSAPHKIATLVDREVWLADFEDSEGNTLALMSEPRLV